MSTVTVEALASFGSGPIPDTFRTNWLLLCGGGSRGPLERYRFEFIDGQEVRPGARGAVRMTFAADRLPPMSGPLLVWAGRIVGHIWGLRTVHRSQSEPAGVAPRTDAPTDPFGLHPAPTVTGFGPAPSVLRPAGQPTR